MITIQRLFGFLKNEIIYLSIVRYLRYAVQMVRGIILAKIFGPYLFGVWGLLMLVMQYLSYTNLGIAYAVNVEISTAGAGDHERRARVVSASLGLNTVLSVALLAAGITFSLAGGDFGSEYPVERYLVVLLMITVLTHVQTVLANVYRSYNSFKKIAYGEFLLAVIPFSTVFFFTGYLLIEALLWSMAASYIIAIAMMAVRPPVRLALAFSVPEFRSLLAVGIPLLIYNVSMLLIMLAGRTVIGIFYPVEEMGLFSLAYSIVSAVMLGVNSVAWILFPTVISRVKKGEQDEAVIGVVNKVSATYSTAVFLLVFTVNALLPLLTGILPKFVEAFPIVSLLLLSQSLLSVAFGHKAFAVARKKQWKVAGVSLLSVIIVSVGGSAVAMAEWRSLWVASAVLAGSLVFSVMIMSIGRSLFERELSQRVFGLKQLLPAGVIIPATVILAGIAAGYTAVAGVAALLMYLAMQWRRLMELKVTAVRLAGKGTAVL